MAIWFELPSDAFGWALWCACWALQLTAVAVIVRDMRGRRTTVWDVAALLFVIVAGPGAAGLLLCVHSFLAARDVRRLGTG